MRCHQFQDPVSKNAADGSNGSVKAPVPYAAGQFSRLAILLVICLGAFDYASALIAGDDDAPDTSGDPDRKPVILVVQLPKLAELELAGEHMSGTGTRRTFRIPPISTKRDYDYPVVARWKRGEKRVVVRRTLSMRGGVDLDVDLQRPEGWPAFRHALSGDNEVRIRNPNDEAAFVGLRQKDGRTVWGVDFDVPADSVRSVYVPDGRCELWLYYPLRPDELFRGDSFVLARNGVEIRLVRVFNGNYGLRRVR